jgi:hypothetical protein
MEETVDHFHRKPTVDTRTASICEFCEQMDVKFRGRNPLDQLVTSSHTACGHITEEGYLLHRMMELKILKLRVDIASCKASRYAA